MIILFSFIFLVFGSFANNIITFFINGQNFDFFRSKCFNCKNTLSISELIPIFSYMYQRGRCKKCNDKISKRYLLVELIILILGNITLLLFNVSTYSFLLFFICYIFLIIAVVDFYKLVIPNILVFCLWILSILKFFLLNIPVQYFIYNIITIILIFSLFHLANLFFNFYYHKQIIGYGDIKLFSAIILIGNLIQFFFVLWFASLIGLVCYIIFHKTFKLRYSDNKIPFGLFLSFSSIILLFFNFDIVDKYIFLLGYIFD